MIPRLLLSLVFVLPVLGSMATGAQAQANAPMPNIEGVWFGTMTQPNGPVASTFAFWVEFGPGNRVRTRIDWVQRKFYAVMEGTFTIQGNQVIIKEDRIIRQDTLNNQCWCLKRTTLRHIAPAGNSFLTGPWVGACHNDYANPCSPGDARIERITDPLPLEAINGQPQPHFAPPVQQPQAQQQQTQQAQPVQQVAQTQQTQQNTPPQVGSNIQGFNNNPGTPPVPRPQPVPNQTAPVPVPNARAPLPGALTITFEDNSYTLTADAQAKLRQYATAFAGRRDLVLSIQGHDDWRLDDARTLLLGRNRARAVWQYMVSLGVPAEKMDYSSAGRAEAAPGAAFASNNRRAVLVPMFAQVTPTASQPGVAPRPQPVIAPQPQTQPAPPPTSRPWPQNQTPPTQQQPQQQAEVAPPPTAPPPSRVVVQEAPTDNISPPANPPTPNTRPAVPTPQQQVPTTPRPISRTQVAPTSAPAIRNDSGGNNIRQYQQTSPARTPAQQQQRPQLSNTATPTNVPTNVPQQQQRLHP